VKASQIFLEKSNASNTGVVKLAAFVRFAQKVTALPRPRDLTC
jgi:hypothetical protein